MRQIDLHPIAATTLRPDFRHRDDGQARHLIGLVAQFEISAGRRRPGTGPLRPDHRGEHRLRRQFPAGADGRDYRSRQEVQYPQLRQLSTTSEYDDNSLSSLELFFFFQTNSVEPIIYANYIILPHTEFNYT